jgi:large subunit ribosomal protein L17
MRHGDKTNALGRKTAHRSAMLSNMASSLIVHKRIVTTLAKAKELRKYVEPLVTKSKTDSTHSRRVVFSYLQSKEAVKELFSTVADKVADRPGGYTRILKTENRAGDNAAMCMMELVDFNEMMLEAKAAKSGTNAAGKKRTRRGSKAAKSETSAPVAKVATAKVVAEEVAFEDVVEETTPEVDAAAETIIEDTVDKDIVVEETPTDASETEDDQEPKDETKA